MGQQNPAPPILDGWKPINNGIFTIYQPPHFASTIYRRIDLQWPAEDSEAALEVGRQITCRPGNSVGRGWSWLDKALLDDSIIKRLVRLVMVPKIKTNMVLYSHFWSTLFIYNVKDQLEGVKDLKLPKAQDAREVLFTNFVHGLHPSHKILKIHTPIVHSP